MAILSRLETTQPLVLILSEPGLQLSELVEDFLQLNSLKTKTILLDQSFFNQSREFFEQNEQVYKIVLLYGFSQIVPDFYREIFIFIDKINEQQNQAAPTILFSGVGDLIETVEKIDQNHVDFLFKQNKFLLDFLSKFPQAQSFLAQDLILTREKITHPLLFFFSTLKQSSLIDPQKTFYFQDENSFFEAVKLRLIKPHSPDKFLLRGKAIFSTALLRKITALYEQYFQKKLAILQIFSELKKPSFISEFVLVKNSKAKIDQLIDQKIRLLPHLQ